MRPNDNNVLSSTWVPPGVDIDTPSAARMYDYYLDGSHNFASDRKAAEKVLAVLPQARTFARQNRGSASFRTTAGPPRARNTPVKRPLSGPTSRCPPASA